MNTLQYYHICHNNLYEISKSLTPVQLSGYRTSIDPSDQRLFKFNYIGKKLEQLNETTRMYIPLPHEWTKEKGILDSMMRNTLDVATIEEAPDNYFILKYFGILV